MAIPSGLESFFFSLCLVKSYQFFESLLKHNFQVILDIPNFLTFVSLHTFIYAILPLLHITHQIKSFIRVDNVFVFIQAPDLPGDHTDTSQAVRII